MAALKHQVGGNHYVRLPAQPVELFRYLDPFEANVMKYTIRLKSGTDLAKAAHYVRLAQECGPCRGQVATALRLVWRCIRLPVLRRWLATNGDRVSPAKAAACSKIWLAGVYLENGERLVDELDALRWGSP